MAVATSPPYAAIGEISEVPVSVQSNMEYQRVSRMQETYQSM